MGAVRNDIVGINPDACTPEDQQANWQNLVTIINNITNTIGGGGGGDTYKVGVDATDVSNATVDFLHAKINDNGTFDSATSLIVKSETIGHLTEKFFADFGSASNYGTNKIFGTDGGGNIQFIDPEFGSDTFKVAVTLADSTPNYLHLSINDNATYVGGADVVVASATVGAALSDQKEQFFVDVSAMTGYAGTGSYVWMTIDNVTRLVETDDGGGGFGDTFKVKSRSDDTVPAYLHDAVNTNAVLVASEDGIVACETTDSGGGDLKEELFLDSSAVLHYVDIPDGRTWALSLTRSGGTKTLKWASTVGISVAIYKTKVDIPAASDSGGVRTPGTVVSTSDNVTKIKGDDFSGEFENWSLVIISANSYLIIMEIDLDAVIIDAFC